MKNLVDTLSENELTPEEKNIIMDYVAVRMIRFHQIGIEERIEIGNKINAYLLSLLDILENKTFSSQNLPVLNRDEQFFYEITSLRSNKNLQATILGITASNEDKRAEISILIDIAAVINYTAPTDSQDPLWYRAAILHQYKQQKEFHILCTQAIYKIDFLSLKPIFELELLLSCTYFDTIENEDRNITQERIISELQRLYYDPITHHVVAALSYIMHEQDGKLVFANSSRVSSNAVAHYNPIYRIIYCPRLLDRSLTRPQGNSIVHEALHFILDIVYKNNFLPFPQSDRDSHWVLEQQMRRLLDKVQRLAINTIDESQVRLGMTMFCKYVDQKSTREQNIKIMMQEIIVFPMQYLAEGYALSTINKFADGVWLFYHKKCLPDIVDFLEEKRKKYSGSNRSYLIYPNAKVEFLLVERRDTSERISARSLAEDELTNELNFSVLIPGAFFDSRYKKNINEQQRAYFYCPGFFTRIYQEDFKTLGHRLWNMTYQCKLLQRWYRLKYESENWPTQQKYWYHAAITTMGLLLCIFSPIAAIAHFLFRLFITNTLACFGDLICITSFNANLEHQDLENFPQCQTWSDTYRSFRS